ncbi:hypothetical protein [Methylobacterium pseudosasicola]|uniref:Uncharacterized protein n=1 Tax=Methylobacterium pseudosasicola TaxID=582667 RepID=A0A1I4TLS2_9HYPH|nr:hypothetical protein [Methylobacterium pseudosasicola]SFM77500.1 hypothetical protein SAMN05192568_105516 [Methylobacterium pseudosasicola]
MSNVVSFPKGRASGRDAEQTVVVTITDRDGSTLVLIPVVPPEEDAVLIMPTDPVEIAFARAALQNALRQLDASGTDPDMGAEYTPA